MKKIILLLSIFDFMLFLLSGCVPSKPTEHIEILPAERLVSRLELNRMRIRTFDGSGTIFIKTNDFENKASFDVTLVKPDSLCFTVMGPFGIQLAQSLIADSNFIFYDALHNTAYEGQVDNNILQNIFKVDLSLEDLKDSFIGAVNLTSHLYKEPTKFSVDNDKYVLTYIDSTTGITTIYFVDIRNLGITDFKVLNKDGATLLEGKYSDFDVLENVSVPYTIELNNYQDGQSVTIKYKKMVANQSGINIDFKVPDDATFIQW